MVSMLIGAPSTSRPIDSKLPADAVGAVAFHPLEPLLLSVSGSRHFDDMDCSANASELDSESSDGSTEDVAAVSRLKERPQPSVRDASIKTWDFMGQSEERSHSYV